MTDTLTSEQLEKAHQTIHDTGVASNLALLAHIKLLDGGSITGTALMDSWDALIDSGRRLHAALVVVGAG